MARYRGPHPEDTSPGWLFRLFVGDDLSQARRWAVIAGVLFGISGAVTAVVSPSALLLTNEITLLEVVFPTSVLHASTVFGMVVILGWVGLAMWPAYRNAGVLVSWGVIVGPMWGVLVAGVVLYGDPGRGPFLAPPFFFFLALIGALVLGTLGFILGTGLRRIRSWWRNDSRDSE